MIPPRPTDDVERVAEIKRAGLLQSPLINLRHKVKQIADVFDVPVSAITVVSRYFQHVKAAVGTDLALMHRNNAFCSYTILGNGVMVVEDALKDPRFQQNPYVTGEPHIRFYAGAPLHTTNGHKVGAICLIDIKPRKLSSLERKLLLKSAADIEKSLS